jgi:hypothetical protein
MKMAEACKVGKGRSEPNINPYLPSPVGRMQWSWNPYTLIVNIFINLILI